MRHHPLEVGLSRRPLSIFLAAAALALAAASSSARLRAASMEANSSRASRDEAIARIPFDELNEDVQTKLRGVVTSPSIYRRLPVKAIDCDPEMYRFMVRYPEVVVNIWELMGLTNIKVERTGPYTFRAADGAGASGDIDLVYGNQNTHLFYLNAEYSGSLFKRRITGRCVLLLTSEYTRTDDNRSRVISQLDMFLQLDNVGAELLAKTLQPLVGKAADHNFVETAAFVGRVSQAAETNGFGVQQLSYRLTKVAPEIRNEFAQIAGRVSRTPLPAGPAFASAEPEDDVGRFRIEPPARLSTTAVPVEGTHEVSIESASVRGAPSSAGASSASPSPIAPFGPRKGMLLKR